MDPRAWRRFRKNRGALFGATLVVFVLLTAMFGPLFTGVNPDKQFSNGVDATTGLPLAPNTTFVMGTDPIGRDEMARLLYGGRISLAVALSATLVAVMLGASIGFAAGYLGGHVDTAAMRTVDVLLSLPFLLIVIALHRILESPSLWLLALILGGLSWTTLARVTRTRTEQIRHLEFIDAARALGYSEWHILLRHVIPNAMAPSIILGTTLVAQMVIAESSMSFLGLGVEPPTASWGSMLQEGMGYIGHAPRLVIYPGLFIVLTVFGFNLLGEGLRDALDPKA